MSKGYKIPRERKKESEKKKKRHKRILFKTYKKL